MQRYVDRLLKLNVNFDEDLVIDIVLHSLPPFYDQFKMTYHLSKNGLKGKAVEFTLPTTVAPVMAIGQGKGKKRKAPPKQRWKEKSHDGSSSSGPKGKTSSVPLASYPKEATCVYYQDKGHWKRSCPKYPQDIKDGKIKPTLADDLVNGDEVYVRNNVKNFDLNLPLNYDHHMLLQMVRNQTVHLYFSVLGEEVEEQPVVKLKNNQFIGSKSSRGCGERQSGGNLSCRRGNDVGVGYQKRASVPDNFV
ncbi:uncharacterized protein LOC128126023 [Lactuca sativa]|uniref:uncharacterized protein LOC128126023 n=1 Tax=Lactuca sativa TaxID=4236 RepID=UPI0022B03AD9|nr:uncharacterized protein LOC128126023 [Lactuca sativa]